MTSHYWYIQQAQNLHAANCKRKLAVVVPERAEEGLDDCKDSEPPTTPTACKRQRTDSSFSPPNSKRKWVDGGDDNVGNNAGPSAAKKPCISTTEPKAQPKPQPNVSTPSSSSSSFSSSSNAQVVPYQPTLREKAKIGKFGKVGDSVAEIALAGLGKYHTKCMISTLPNIIPSTYSHLVAEEKLDVSQPMHCDGPVTQTVLDQRDVVLKRDIAIAMERWQQLSELLTIITTTQHGASVLLPAPAILAVDIRDQKIGAQIRSLVHEVAWAWHAGQWLKQEQNWGTPDRWSLLKRCAFHLVCYRFPMIVRRQLFGF